MLSRSSALLGVASPPTPLRIDNSCISIDLGPAALAPDPAPTPTPTAEPMLAPPDALLLLLNNTFDATKSARVTIPSNTLCRSVTHKCLKPSVRNIRYVRWTLAYSLMV